MTAPTSKCNNLKYLKRKGTWTENMPSQIQTVCYQRTVHNNQSLKFRKERFPFLAIILWRFVTITDSLCQCYVIIASYLRYIRQAYNLQNYWVFGFFPSSGILENGKHISETGSVSVLRWGGEDTYSLGSLQRANLDHWTTPARFTQLFNHPRPG
jgi:hypothetical protein